MHVCRWQRVFIGVHVVCTIIKKYQNYQSKKSSGKVYLIEFISVYSEKGIPAAANLSS